MPTQERIKLPFTQGRFEVRLAKGPKDMVAAQELRYQLFFEKKGIAASPEAAALRRDFDEYDAHCDHLLVIHRSKETGAESTAGYYRLMRRAQADSGCGFYSASQFDLSILLKNDGLLELGRLCIDPTYREGYVFGLLLRGVAAYVEMHDIRYLFGCASQRGTNPAVYARALHALYEEGRIAPEHLLARSLPGRHEPLLRTDGEGVPQEKLERLLDFYFGFADKKGAYVSDVLFIDTAMQCIDLFLVVDAKSLAMRVALHFLRER